MDTYSTPFSKVNMATSKVYAKLKQYWIVIITKKFEFVSMAVKIFYGYSQA